MLIFYIGCFGFVFCEGFFSFFSFLNMRFKLGVKDVRRLVTFFFVVVCEINKPWVL